ncbi:serine hydrolase domain-containing protein [Vibrio sp. LaRot3]|uniref:serine hydrolase domain-containing protein n=1 Tax=Vibrio sp. LaRot3 TaxID=2998829 RepID=UPI0022CE0D06|nr:serine hydrolase [Vibrio sp. LaRot3]MDA0148537.1 serine hydrolase [Vibrio sp. LaRot3]
MRLIGILALLLVGCGQPDIDVVVGGESFAPIVERVESGKANNIHSLIVWQQGEKVFELHRQGGGMIGTRTAPSIPVGANERHNQHSITKSFVATLIFIAIDEGKLESLDVPIFSLFPEYQADDRDQKLQITIRDVMNMSTGYALDELATSYASGSGNPFMYHYYAKDLTAQFLEAKLAFKPGTRFAYSGLSTVGLSKVIEQLYQQPFTKVMQRKIFEPLGIENYQWETNQGSGEAGADWGLRLTPEDMGKFGELWLNKGEFRGRRLLSEQWFRQLQQSKFYSYTFGYGLHFWQVPLVDGAVSAVGIGEQYIMMLPSKKAVIVATGGNYDMPQSPTYTTIVELTKLL